MFGFLFISSLVLLAAAAGYLYARRRRRGRVIAGVLSGSDLLAHWTYEPDEWRRAAEEFTWAKNPGGRGEVYVSASAVYVKSDTGDGLIDLSSDGRVVTHASYRGAEMSPLKLRVRRKVVERYPDRADEVKYFKEDYLIPVPARCREEAKRVADFFTARLENNLAAYAEVVSDDEPLSIFGKDSF